MIRRLNTALLTIALLVSMASLVSYAQNQPTMTRHVYDVQQNGRAVAIGQLPGNQAMELTLVLPLRNEPALNAFLQDVYDPSSANYRHFLTVEQFTRMFGPSAGDYDVATQWAKQNGFKVTSTSRNRMILQIAGTAANVEQALHVTMNVYRHPTENRTFFAPDREPTADMSVQLYRIGGLDNFSTPHANYVRRQTSDSIFQGKATTGSCPSASFCGSDMRAAYYGATTLTGTGQSVGLFEFLGTNLQDVTTYYTNAHQVNNVPINLISVDGVTTQCNANQGCDDTEQTLDITQALGMAPGLRALNVYIGKSTGTLDDAGILNGMATASPLDSALSCSWSWTPPDPSTDDPFFMEFAAQGQNMFVAAGDSGHWTSSLTFVWPADDPFIVSVGGTDLTTASAGGAWASETGWVDSGGGISPNKFAIPSWQTAAAAGCTSCSKTIRNGPDVAANANFTFYVCADQTTCSANQFGGTSFAAPMWAGYLALANQQAVSMGKSPLGFINPAVYTIGLGTSYLSNFHDITSGNNGFSATPGYDLITGWGSPNGATLINSLTAGGGSKDFTVTANPTKVQIQKGHSGTTTITTTVSGGFNSAITLSSSLATSSFSPNPIPAPGSGTSTMTINVGANISVGVHTLTITATGGGITHTTTVKIKVTN